MRAPRVRAILLTALIALPTAGVEATIAATAAGAATLPSAPHAVSAVPGDGAATVLWKVPTSNGGSAITGYVVTPYLANVAQTPHVFSPTKTKVQFGGLTNGHAYSFKVAAQNANGRGAVAKSGSIIVGAPGPPQQGIGTQVNNYRGGLTVFAGLANKNGSTITHYTGTCTSSNGGATKSKVNNGSSYLSAVVVVKGATSGKTYRCFVTATNARGTGPKSTLSPAIVAA
jgi:hypothetical protein